MPVMQCIGTHTHRQYRAWSRWLDEQWDQPSRTDYYLIQVAYLVWCVMSMFSSSKTHMTWANFKIKFKSSYRSEKVSKEQQATASKSAWFGMFGGLASRKLHKAAQAGVDAQRTTQGNGQTS